jgi:flagella basal body P-ring formation protein FlgA
MRALILILVIATGLPAFADTVFAQKTIRPREVITADAVYVTDIETAGAAQTLESVIGAEAKHAIYAGRPVLRTNIMRAAVIERNQVAAATFVLNGLTIATEARALERGSVGDVIRAMNLTSRNTIRAEVLEDGNLKVLP